MSTASAPPRRRPHPGDPGWFQILTATQRLWPDFLILGAQRGGTTSLFRSLEQHPDVVSSSRKEIHYFDYQMDRGDRWYRGHFPLRLWQTVRRRQGRPPFRTGEATPYYFACPQAPRRAFGAVPGARLIVLLRNPIDRAWSHFRMARGQNTESLSFEDALRAEPERLRGEYEKLCADDAYYSFSYHRQSYMTRGIYLRQLQDWLKFYERSQLLVLKSEDFYSAPPAVYRRVCEFLGLKDWQPGKFEKFNAQGSRDMLPETRVWLSNYFRPHNAALSEFLGADFHWD
jgi:hypothetical protein